ncbi:MAG: DUF4013 domain-containing protein [Candidatus Diapherotrites archaeon]|nr:DUF4013 domain-containing protein [Candidatus Micrarchaeota archaeon]MBU1939818.1 DUF4013 domain-containing protein [Candidatus Micrarchaeota archaeon]
MGYDKYIPAEVMKPFSNFRAWAIGAIFSLPPINLIGCFFLAGYGVKMARLSLKGNTSVPAWGEAGNRLVVDGIKLWMIYLVYFIPAILALIAGLFVSAGLLMLGISPEITFALLALSVLFAALLKFLALPCATYAVLRFADNTFRSAFDFGTCIKGAFTMPFLQRFIFAGLYCLALTILSLGILFPVVIFPIIVTFFSAMADAYRKLK